MFGTHQSIALKAKFFRGLSDAARLSILEALLEGEKSVSEIITKSGLSQSNCSGHLTCLKECGLVICRRDGRFIYYQLADQEVAVLLKNAEEILSRVAEKVYMCTRYDELQSQE
ncbi:MAG: metalloregulator ArsR/SmtB family transcription factor [Actinobacteria bacterium]|nr:metalloregulator ArsR/SmtB family transcription factor [Actinomycetota bacterium]